MININKKLISLLLVVTMLCSLSVSTFATTDYTNGTTVTYVGKGSESYTITVPANLLPGTGGTVTLQGKWATNRVVNVTADASVELVNSINANDKKTLTVTFDGISESGSNTEELTFTETVSVSNIQNALFGTWSGKFNYNVEVGTVNGEVVMLEGDGQVVNKFAFPEVRFRSSAPVDELTEVKINGEVVDPDNYIVSDGSTVITFTNDYVESLNLTEEGEQHSIEIVSESGTADGGFTVVNLIPDGGKYVTANGEVYGPGENFPSDIKICDSYTFGDYEYRYGYTWCAKKDHESWSDICGCNFSVDHWAVHVIDGEKTAYGEILTQINGDLITDLTQTFAGCDKLISSPKIPYGVTSMEGTFADCYALTNAPVIPNSVVDMVGTFEACKLLKKAPAIPDDVTDLSYTFNCCTSLIEAPAIPENVTIMNYTFSGCESLEIAPTVHSGVTEMNFIFHGCKTLKSYMGSTDTDGDFSDYIIPNGVTVFNSAFQDCILLTIAPDLQISTNVLSSTFQGCTALTETPILPDNAVCLRTFANCTALTTVNSLPSGSNVNLYETFSGCTSLKNIPAITSSVTAMYGTFTGCTSLTGTITINANPTLYVNCFKNVDFVNQNITLAGESTLIDNMGATGLNYCATCNGVCIDNH